MIRTTTRFFCGVLLLISTSLQAQILSKDAFISILTFGPSQEELYAAFGHSAVRVCDPINHIDWTYNYGTFDYNQPFFYLNFAKGHLLYQISRDPYPLVEEYYKSVNRSIVEQVLRLSLSQKQKVFDALEKNNIPENRNYYYDYFYNNCATKIRDVVALAVEPDIIFHHHHISSLSTIRELTDAYLVDQPWGDLGIDLCLGMPMDVTLDPYMNMFLPEYLALGFSNAEVKDFTGFVPLVLSNRVIFSAIPEYHPVKWTHPYLLFSLFLVLIIWFSLREKKAGVPTRWVDSIWLLTTGLFGLFLSLLWGVTDHVAAANNMNILWALPTHLFVIIALQRNAEWVRYYFRGVTVLYVFILVGWGFLPQSLPPAMFPLVAAFCLRAAMLSDFSFLRIRIRKIKKAEVDG